MLQQTYLLLYTQHRGSALVRQPRRIWDKFLQQLHLAGRGGKAPWGTSQLQEALTFMNCSPRILQAVLKTYPHQAWVPGELPWMHPLCLLNHPSTAHSCSFNSSFLSGSWESAVIGEGCWARHEGEDPREEKVHREGRRRRENLECDAAPCWILFSISYYIVHLLPEMISPPCHPDLWNRVECVCF